MALSQRKTTLAVLRGILGGYHGREAIFAKLVGKSVSWVKKTSAGLVPLSEYTARELHHATGIDLAWLLNNDVNQPPICSKGKPYTIEIFTARRVELTSGELKVLSVVTLQNVLPEIAAVASAAGKSGKVSLFDWRYREFVKTCREEFGFDEDARSAVLDEISRARLAKVSINDGMKDAVSGERRTFELFSHDEAHEFSRLYSDSWDGSVGVSSEDGKCSE